MSTLSGKCHGCDTDIEDFLLEEGGGDTSTLIFMLQYMKYEKNF